VAGLKAAAAEMVQIRLQRDEFHGEWNYEIMPRAETVIS